MSKTIKQVSSPIPTANPNEVVVQIKAAALNPVEEQLCVLAFAYPLTWSLTDSFRAQSSDLILTKLFGAPPMGTPFVPCWDFSGIIESVGDDFEDYKSGDEIFGVIQNINGRLWYIYHY